jgi:DNA-binding transcriptional LysR family regulator
MKFSLEQVRHVLAVERFRHFGRAAEQLGITQPALSRSIAAVEERLECRLFERSRRGVETTQDGLLFLEQGRKLLSAAMQLEADLVGRSETEQDELALACALFPASLSLAPALRRLARGRPGVDLAVEITDWHRAHARMRSGAVQLLLGELLRDDAIEGRLLNRSPLRLVTDPAHPLAQLDAPTQEQVLSYPWASPSIPPRALPFFGTAIAAGRLDRAQGSFTPAVVVASLETALSLVRETPLVTVAPLSLVHERLQAGALKLVQFQAPWLRLNYGFSWRREGLLTQAARSFMTLVEEEEQHLLEREEVLAVHYRCSAWANAA